VGRMSTVELEMGGKEEGYMIIVWNEVEVLSIVGYEVGGIVGKDGQGG